jgi:type III pantothenate kinase
LNLVIDKGNSRTKVAILSGKQVLKLFHPEDLDIPTLETVLKQFPEVKNAILSAVSDVAPEIKEFLVRRSGLFIEFTHVTPVPLLNGYLTPATLGLDRLAAAVGANTEFPGFDVLIIDAGTAITFDLVERSGTFVGGNISPGLRSRFRALHEFTSRLPLIAEAPEWPLIGKTTEDAIRSGVVSGMILEIDGTIELLKKNYPSLVTVLTGGDASFFERRLKNHIFAKFEITLIGLNRILEYNVEKQ